MKKIAIIGGGNMGEALIKGLRGNSVYVCEADAKRAKYLKSKYKVRSASLTEAVEKAAIIIFAVKPQDMAALLEQIKGAVEHKLYISIAAGLTTQFFEKNLGGKARVVRCMPNMPALIGEGITGVCKGKYATAADLKSAQTILKTIGETVVVRESMLDAVTAVSGSGPAYVFLFVEQWMASARSLGFNQGQARQLVYKTLLGSTHLLEKSQFDAGQLRAKVTSKGGTTQAAMDVFFKAKFDQIFKKALQAANKRAKELSK